MDIYKNNIIENFVSINKKGITTAITPFIIPSKKVPNNIITNEAASKIAVINKFKEAKEKCC